MLPALMVEHNLPYDPDVVMPRLMRDYAVLSHVPAILTLIDFEGKVLYQVRGMDWWEKGCLDMNGPTWDKGGFEWVVIGPGGRLFLGWGRPWLWCLISVPPCMSCCLQNASSLEYMGDQLSAKFDSQVCQRRGLGGIFRIFRQAAASLK